MENTEKKIITKPEYKYSELTGRIIGCAMEVHRILGNGFQEKIYQRALAYPSIASLSPDSPQHHLQASHAQYIALLKVDVLKNECPLSRESLQVHRTM